MLLYPFIFIMKDMKTVEQQPYHNLLPA